MTKKSASGAAALSLIPGLGHLYVGRTKKGAALLVLFVTVVLTPVLFRSRMAVVLAVGVYCAVMLPAAVETYTMVRTGRVDGLLSSKGYVIAMLLTNGFGALPLLWQDARFSRRSKVLWSVAVPLLAVLYLSALIRWRSEIEKFIWK